MLCSYCSKEIHVSRKGLCGACYARQVRNGTPETVQVNRRLGITECSFCGSTKAPFVKTLCKTCWQRNRMNGTPEPRVSKTFCTAPKCEDLAVARGFCERHYRRFMKLGDLSTKRAEGWGAKTKHPLYDGWRWMIRQGPRNGGVDNRWQDFWSFVDDVGERPAERWFLKRKREGEPYGPTNFVWNEPILDEPHKRADRASKAAYMRAYYIRRPEVLRKSHLKRQYGLTPEDEAKMLAEQGGVCAICRQPEIMKHKRTGELLALAVDHCHETGVNRGLLCRWCNTALGMFGDSSARFRAAADYLDRHSPKRVEGFRHVATLPEGMGNITGLREENGALVATTESGVDFVLPKNRLVCEGDAA